MLVKVNVLQIKLQSLKNCEHRSHAVGIGLLHKDKVVIQRAVVHS